MKKKQPRASADAGDLAEILSVRSSGNSGEGDSPVPRRRAELEEPLFSHGDVRIPLAGEEPQQAALRKAERSKQAAGGKQGAEVTQEGASKAKADEKQVSILEQASQKTAETQRQTRSAYGIHKQRMLDRKRARRKRRRISFLVTLAVLALVSFLVYILPIFHLKQIEVVGAKHIQTDELAAAADVKIGGHLLQGWGGNLMQIISLRNSAAEERIKERFPYVERVKVGIKLPSTALITVEERIPVSYVQVANGVALLDKNGILLDIQPAAPPNGIPLIQNVQVTDLNPGHVISPDTKEEIRSAMLLLDALIRNDAGANDGFNLLSQVMYIRPDSKGNCYITLREPYAMPETSFKLGEVQTLDVSLTWLRYLVRTMKVSELGKGILDLNTKVFKIEEELY